MTRMKVKRSYWANQHLIRLHQLGLYLIDSEGIVLSERNNLNNNFFDRIERLVIILGQMK